MTAGAFDVSVRAVECSGCGAPLTVPSGGGTTTCEFCGATNIVALRQVEERPVPPSAADDVARLARLETQRNTPLPDNPFDLRRPPPGLEETESVDAFRDAFDRGKQRADLPRLQSAQRDLCWVATHLATRLAQTGEHLRARAVLETALDRLPDPGHRHILRCRLARLACRDGELEAAEGWLAECDPAPEVLALDTELRLAQAELDLHRREPEVALERLGETRGRVPMSDVLIGESEPLRLAAEAMRGRQEQAEAQLFKLAYGDRHLVRSLREMGVAPGLVEAQELAEQRAAARVRTMAPVAWAFTPLAALATAGVMMLVNTGRLDPDGYYGLIFAGLMVAFSLGMGLGIGATQRRGGIWWGAAALGAFALLPLAGLIVMIVIAYLVYSSTPADAVEYSRPAEQPFYVGLITIALLSTVLVMWSALATT